MRLIDDDRSLRSEFGKGLKVKGQKKGKGEGDAHELSPMIGERTPRLSSGKRQRRR